MRLKWGDDESANQWIIAAETFEEMWETLALAEEKLVKAQEGPVAGR